MNVRLCKERHACSTVSSWQKGRPCAAQQRAFSLIEMIGVVTVLALLALALTPILIKQFDRIAGEKEVAQLKAFAKAYRQGITTTRSIPDQSGTMRWYTMIASNLGINDVLVRTNERRVERIFMVDPNFRIRDNASTLPYVQSQSPPGSELKDNFGNTLPPASPRVMILSSLSQPLPQMFGPSVFDDLWNSPEGTPPTWLTGSLAWGGKPEDLKIQRIHLGDLFVQIILNNQDFVPVQFAIDGSLDWVPENSFQPLVTNSVWRFFIDGTVLTLYDTNDPPRAQYSEILHESKSFVLDGASWKAGGYSGPTIHHPDAVDLELVAQAFLKSYTNSAATYTPLDVYNSMLNYMQRYVDWADGCSSSLYGPLVSAQTDLANKSKDLITK